MARRSPQTFAKRQREHKRAEKAKQKLAKRAMRRDPNAQSTGTEDVVPSDRKDEPNGVDCEDGGGDDRR